MIEVLGQSPINSAVTAGRSYFTSILRNKVSTSFGGDPNSSRYSRTYTSARGILINKEFVQGAGTPDLKKGYQFQFNPANISDVKNTLYETRQYAGLSYVDYIWGGGGERIISFQLFLDNTPQSKTREFRPTAYGSSLAQEIKTEGNGYAYTNFEYKKNGAYSISRVHERGVLPEVELLQSYLYPAPLIDEKTPLFAEGGVVSTNQFRPPATVIFALGPFYLEGVVKSAQVNYTLFDQDLTPIRATVDIEFAVFEFEDISNNRKIPR